MADNETDQLAAARKLIPWIYVGIGFALIILLIDYMLKQQIARMAVNVAHGQSAQPVAPDTSDFDFSGGGGGADLDGDAVKPKADGDAGGPPPKLPRAPRGGPGGRSLGDDA